MWLMHRSHGTPSCNILGGYRRAQALSLGVDVNSEACPDITGWPACLIFHADLYPSRPWRTTPGGSPRLRGGAEPMCQAQAGVLFPHRAIRVPTWELRCPGLARPPGVGCLSLAQGGWDEGKGRGDTWVILAAHVSCAKALLMLLLLNFLLIHVRAWPRISTGERRGRETEFSLHADTVCESWDMIIEFWL